MKVVTQSIKQAANQKSWPKEYVCNILEPGLVSYEDVGCGIALLRKEAIIKMLPSFVGKPVIPKEHKDVTPEDFEDHAVGYVTRAWWDDMTNWAYFAFILTKDEAKEDVEQHGYSVSCAYDVIETGPGGEHHAIKYDEEILNGSGTHLALVLNPRYESCKIGIESSVPMLVNCKNAKILTPEYTSECSGCMGSGCNKCNYKGRTNRNPSYNSVSLAGDYNYDPYFEIGIKVTSLPGVAFKEPVEVVKIAYDNVWVKDSQGDISGPHKRPKIKNDLSQKFTLEDTAKSYSDKMEKEGYETEINKTGEEWVVKAKRKENAKYGLADLKVGQEIRTLGGMEFKVPMKISKLLIHSGQLFLRAPDGEELGPFTWPLDPKKNKVDPTYRDSYPFPWNIGDSVNFRMKTWQLAKRGKVVGTENKGGVQTYTIKGENGLTYTLRVSGGSPQNFETLVRANKKREDSKMIKLFRRANDKAGAEIDPENPIKKKWNADSLLVKIDDQMVPVSKLVKSVNGRGFIPVDSVENEIEVDGVKYNMNELIENYKTSRLNGDDKEDKENEEDEEKENQEDKEEEMKKEQKKKNQEEKEAKEAKKNKEDMENEEEEDKEDEEDKENEEDEDKEEDKENEGDEEEEETIQRNNSKKKKGVNHFVRLNKAKENSDTLEVPIVDTMYSRVDRGKSRYGTAV